jgi:hypothetical protein
MADIGVVCLHMRTKTFKSFSCNNLIFFQFLKCEFWDGDLDGLNWKPHEQVFNYFWLNMGNTFHQHKYS